MATRRVVVKMSWMIQKGMRTFFSHGESVAGAFAIFTPFGSPDSEGRGAPSRGQDMKRPENDSLVRRNRF